MAFVVIYIVFCRITCPSVPNTQIFLMRNPARFLLSMGFFREASLVRSYFLYIYIYMNDLIECTDQASFALFADETNIFVAGKTYSESVETANDILRCVLNYTRANKLHIHIDKKCVMYFQPNINSN